MTHPRRISPLVLCCTFAVLMILLLSTIGFAQLQLGSWNTPIGLAISIMKTLLIVVLFMNMLNSSGTVRLVACSAMLWLCFAIMLVVADYRTRGWDETPESGLAKGMHVDSYDRVTILPISAPTDNSDHDEETSSQ